MVILSIFGIISFLAVLGILAYSMIKFNNMPVETANAKVVSKRISRRGSNGGRSYFIMFEINKENIEFRANSAAYYSLVEGTEGILSYKGNIFVDFK